MYEEETMVSRRLLLAGLGAAGVSGWGLESQAASQLGTMAYPYHPLIFHLDLSILTYHLYGQSLVWPFDPYYETARDRPRRPEGASDRAKLMAQVHADMRWKRGTDWPGKGLHKVRGPQLEIPHSQRISHDPILYRYSQINPRRSCLNRPEHAWLLYESCPLITDPIRDVHVVYKDVRGQVQHGEVKPYGAAVEASGQDRLYCFEGVTGAKTEKDLASRSLMGFVLKRRYGDGLYDLHIAFRGSRSGKLSRTVRQAYRDDDASGNPDWITDLGCNRNESAPLITSVGAVSRGFEATIVELQDCMQKCLELAAEGVSSPTRITVTGHSLGGALAQHFVSSVLLNQCSKIRHAFEDWPWNELKLVTYSAPRAGDRIWAEHLTEKLDAGFWSSLLRKKNPDALPPENADIKCRLQATDQPAAFRVLVSNDPITTEQNFCHGGKHVGTAVYVDKGINKMRVSSKEAHSPDAVRKCLLDALKCGGVPPRLWSAGEAVKIAEVDHNPSLWVDSIIEHHQSRNEPFDADQLRRDLDTFYAIRSRSSN